MSFLQSLGSSSLFLLALAVFSGILLGKIRLGGMSLGSSGALFTGLAIGALGGDIPKPFFDWNLLIFVASVGLLAARDILGVLRWYGMKFVILAVGVTGVGALSTALLGLLAGTASPEMLGGAYVGAYTSSPGLGAALELSGGSGLVAAGFSVAYPFGVLAVVLFVQGAPHIFGIDVKRERQALEARLHESPGEDAASEEDHSCLPLSLLSFVFCLVAGILLGRITLPLGPLGNVGVGTSGGTLLMALFLGALGRLGPLDFRAGEGCLKTLRELSLLFFLAAAGIQAGEEAVIAFRTHGMVLALIGLGSAAAGILFGFFLGWKVWKMNWVLLAGAICGAMTSTPGLGAAIDATGTEDCAAGYGGTYPVAILCMVIFTTLLQRFLELF